MSSAQHTTVNLSYLFGWYVVCTCGNRVENMPTQRAAANAQRVHRNDAKVAASMGVAL